jgi:hypothetical protein
VAGAGRTGVRILPGGPRTTRDEGDDVDARRLTDVEAAVGEAGRTSGGAGVDEARQAEVRAAALELQQWAASTPGWKPATVTQPQLARMATAFGDLLADRDALAAEVEELRTEVAALRAKTTQRQRGQR